MSVFISQSPTLRRLLPIQIKVVYNSVLFSELRITLMLEQLEAILTYSATDPTLPIGKMSLITPRSLEVLPNPKNDLFWDQFNGKNISLIPTLGAITNIFSHNAHQNPTRVCVRESIAAETPVEYTYQTIDEASNILAHHLIDQGVKREDVVVLYSYRGVDLVVAIMGVLKAGATFSVIDPAYPPQRQNGKVKLNIILQYLLPHPITKIFYISVLAGIAAKSFGRSVESRCIARRCEKICSKRT
jgi:L-aminoadipate-semialdehyde dehydrogenase